MLQKMDAVFSHELLSPSEDIATLEHLTEPRNDNSCEDSGAIADDSVTLQMHAVSRTPELSSVVSSEVKVEE